MVEYSEEITGIVTVQLYEAGVCRSIIEDVMGMGAWMPAKVSTRSGEGFNSAARPETRLASVFAPARESEISRQFYEKMDRAIKPLVEKLWGVNFKLHSETHFVRYVAGDYYKPHSDTGLHRNDRYFTVICYLNDDFQGGQTSFPRLNYSVSPSCGKAVIFPATYLHSAEPVIRGEKYVIVTWLTGTPPIRWTR